MIYNAGFAVDLLESRLHIAKRKVALLKVCEDVSDYASGIGHAFAPINLKKPTLKIIKEAAHALLAELKASEGWEQRQRN